VSGPRYLRAVPDPRDVVVLDWIREREPVDAGPVLDAVFETLADIRQVRPWPWDAAVERLRPLDPSSSARRRIILLVAAALVLALLAAVITAGGPTRRLTSTPGPSATLPAAIASSTPRVPFPLAALRLEIAGADFGQLRLVSSDGSRDNRIGDDIVASLAQPDWLRDGTRVLVIGRSDDLEQQWEVDPTDLVASQVVLPCVAPCNSRNEASYSPDGTAIIFFEAKGEPVGGIPPQCSIRRYDRASQTIEPIHEFACGTEDDREPRISPDGASVAFWRSRHSLPEPSQTVEESAIFVRDLETGEERRITDWDVHASSVDWSPDGQWLTFTKE
jgi:hypothetical protein